MLATMLAIQFFPVSWAGLRRFTHYVRLGTFSRPGFRGRAYTSSVPGITMMSLQLQRARTLLTRIRDVRVLVVGDLMLDAYLTGGASRVSPEAPVPVVRIGHEWRALGGAANVAANLAALGARAPLVGVVGADAAATDFGAVCDELGIDRTGVVPITGRPTTVKTRVLVGHHQVARYDREADDDIAPADAEELRARVETLGAHAHAIVLEDYDKGVMVPAVIEAALDVARRRAIPVVVDPKARRFLDYAGCTVFKPNLSELAFALRAPVYPEDAEWMERTRLHLQCEHLLVTLGPDGMALTPGGDGGLFRVPAIARSVYDVSGAGDTVTAVMAAALAAGGSPTESAILATHAAGIEVGKSGVATVAPEEILTSLADHRGRAEIGDTNATTRSHT
jgi:rfaE bifunctional protein kinase chain/domain